MKCNWLDFPQIPALVLRSKDAFAAVYNCSGLTSIYLSRHNAIVVMDMREAPAYMATLWLSYPTLGANLTDLEAERARSALLGYGCRFADVIRASLSGG